MNEPQSESTPASRLSPRQVLFLLLTGFLGATTGYEVGLQVGVAVAPREGVFLAPGYSLWPAAMIGAVLGVVVFVPLMWSLRGDDVPAESHAPRPTQQVLHAHGHLAKAPRGTYLLAILRGAFFGCPIGALVAVLGVVGVVGTHDSWFWMLVITFGQLGAVIGVVVGGMVEPLRVRYVRGKVARL